jgi:hypothetical protein
VATTELLNSVANLATTDKHAVKTTAPPRQETASVGASKSLATPDSTARFDSGFSIAPNNNADYLQAAKLIIQPPPQTELALQGVDPRRLRANFQRGVIALRSDGEGQIATGARLVSVVAILGYEPARLLISQRYPASSIIRSTVSSTEAVRYSLDPLVIPGAKSEGNRNFLVLLASYFSGRHALSAYATDLLAVLRDDQRLQTVDRLQLLFSLLARVRGACTAVAKAIVQTRTMAAPECSSELQVQVENYLRTTPLRGLEAQSRRQALRLLDSGELERSVVALPAAE